MNRITEGNGRMGTINTWGREMYDMRDMQRNGRKSVQNGKRMNKGVINEKLRE